MAKAQYIGVATSFPIYTEQTQTVAITSSNVSQYFTVTNGSYYFAGSGNVFTSNNAGVNSSTAQTTLTAKTDISALTFNYSYSSEQNYDKFTLSVGGTTIESAVSGSTTTKSYSGSLSAGASIVMTYAKDSSQHKNDDKCTVSNISITTKVRTQTGTETKSVARKVTKEYIGVSGVARKVTKGYIGVNGVARQYFSGGTPISSVAVGGTVKVAENGTPVDYIVVQIGTPNSTAYANCDGYWLLRKNAWNYNDLNYYIRDDDGDQLAEYDYNWPTVINSNLTNYIRNAEVALYNRYPARLRSIILSPTLPVYSGYNSTPGTVVAPCNVFHLGHLEINGWTSYNRECVLAYFANAAGPREADPLRVAYDDNGNAQSWWLRDCNGGGSYRPGAVYADGSANGWGAKRYRPCFIVPKTAKLEDLLG